MASPYYRCPQCHSVSRKNDNMFEMVEMSGSGTVFAVAGGAPCPDCGARNNFDDVYLHPKYDVPIEDVYGGKCGVNLQLVRRASDAGQIRLSDEEQRLLRQARQSSGSGLTPSHDPNQQRLSLTADGAGACEWAGSRVGVNEGQASLTPAHANGSWAVLHY